MRERKDRAGHLSSSPVDLVRSKTIIDLVAISFSA